MGDDEAVAVFRKFEIFGGFNDEQLRLLAFVSEERALARGDTLYVAGEKADGAYVLVTGTLEGIDGDLDGAGARAPYPIVAPALIGEMGLMLTRPRATSIRARSSAQLLYIPREPFLKLLRNDPELAESVSAILRAELARYLERIAQIAPKFSQ
ncbi:Crp/Fnr family transcriptional regulator [Pelagibacterium xiamenense]|uniref:Crp/Fnr family transcriptional regulator n=1 Tax=Pelagibacterium xiamenense TaxID=2901140 RepID=UPI001E2F4F5B|nr:cyclic nucleotide-binding domain-containing protein [Pelagibacterium xiamenense]MCD7058414.1 cyclic nucleotide-binding domain-containing protein [Pelagibacterium xiamenense]